MVAISSCNSPLNMSLQTLDLGDRSHPNKNVRAVVFVPGLMGSSLLYKGQGRLGEEIEKYLWSEDVLSILSEETLTTLALPVPTGGKVVADRLIRRVALFGLHVRTPEVYGPIVDYMRRLCADKETEFVEFPYDWRLSNSDSATTLADVLLERFGSIDAPKLVIVTHSMGGLVSTLALAKSVDLRKLVRMRIHIAAPFHGSIKAFSTLKVRPALNPAYDSLAWALLTLWDVRRALSGRVRCTDLLMNAIRTFSSIYELLPPGDISPLVTDIDEPYSCVDQNVWETAFRRNVGSATEVQETFARAMKLADMPPFRVIYSASHDTVSAYRIRSDRLDSDDVREDSRRVLGDGTVSGESAFHGSPVAARYREKKRPNEHISICGNRATMEKLAEYIWETEVQNQ
jgi:pimeloyl-ACP methyl ester carboxylesterase